MSFIKLVNKKNKVKLTSTEEYIYDFIMQNSSIVSELSESELSRRIPCSHSSTSRFINKMGFKNYNEFIFSILYEEKMQENIPIDSFWQKTMLVNNKISSQLKLQTNKINTLVQKIFECKKIVFYGQGLSGNIAQYITWHFINHRNNVFHSYYVNEVPTFIDDNTLLFILLDDEGILEFEQLLNTIKAKNPYISVINLSELSKKHFDGINILINIEFPIYFQDNYNKNFLKKEIMRYVCLKILDTYLIEKLINLKKD